MPETPKQAELPEAFVRTVEALTTPGVSYALIGGLAVACYGIPRPTRDIDVLLSAPRIGLPGLLERFAQRGFSFELQAVLRELAEDRLTTLRYGGVRVDVLDAVLPFFRRVIEEATQAEIEGCRVRVASAPALVALKLLAARDTDLRDVRGILAAQEQRLDLESVRRALRECGAEAQERVLEELARDVWGTDAPPAG